jgi:hypothetical protein
MRALFVSIGLLSAVAIFTPPMPAAFAEPSACATRQFHNNSALTWTITLDAGGTCAVDPANPQSRCPVGPGQTAKIYYTGGGSLLIDSATFFNKFPIGSCSYLFHHGATGNVVLNSPGEGDVQTCGAADYPCIPPQPSNCATRSFENHSPLAWSIAMTGGGTCAIGASASQSECAVGPGEIVSLNYPHGASGGAITLQSGVFLQTFQVNGCYLVHEGNTGNVVLNDPNDGDVKTCGQPGYVCNVSR